MATPITSEELAERIGRLINSENAAIVPLVGAGLSAASGIPTTPELSTLTTLCIVKALGLDGQNGPDGIFWHPYRNAWPEMEGDWAERSRRGKERLRSVVRLKYAGPGGPIRRYLNICEEALGCLVDWRSALLFLARITTTHEAPPPGGQSPQPPSREAEKCELPDDLARREEYGWLYNKSPQIIEGLKHLVLDRRLPQAITDAAKMARRSPKKKKSGRLLEESVLARKQVAEDTRNILSFVNQIGQGGDGGTQLVLGDVDQQVIDSFFSHLVAHKRPSMAHRMLVHLARPFHTRAVLTLNFDELVEQAFRESNAQPSVLAVHQNAAIPPWSLCGAGYTVVKLHGGRHGLRADYSLDEEPSELDHKCFASYFTQESNLHPFDSGYSRGAASPPARPAKSHLLLAGISGRDRRVRLLVQRALECVPGLAVFWCCYSQGDADEVARHFPENAGGERVFTIRHSHLGLLLFETYQHIQQCLPPGGLEIPVSWRLPIPPQLADAEEEDRMLRSTRERREAVEEILEWERTWEAAYNSNRHPSDLPRVVVLSQKDARKRPPVVDREYGITNIGWHLFDRWNEKARCMWLETQSLSGAQDFARRLLEALSAKLEHFAGKPSLPVTYTKISFDSLGSDSPGIGGLNAEIPNPKAYVNEALRLLHRSSGRWVLFLNARSSHGYEADPFARLFTPDEPPKGEWSTYLKGRLPRWESQWNRSGADSWRAVRDFIATLVQQAGGQLAVVVLSRPDVAALGAAGLLAALRPPARSEPPLRPLLHREFAPLVEGPKDWSGERVKAAEKFANEEEDRHVRRKKVRFLRLLTHYHSSCHRLALVDADEVSASDFLADSTRRGQLTLEEVDTWLRQLYSKKVIRRRNGGFIWMHWKVKERLRFVLRTDPRYAGLLDRPEQLHLSCARWEIAYYRASGEPLAVFNAVYHRCRAAQLALTGPEPRHAAARSALCEARDHFKEAEGDALHRAQHWDAARTIELYAAFVCRCMEQNSGISDLIGQETSGENQRNVRLLLMLKLAAMRQRLTMARDGGQVDIITDSCQLLQSWFQKWARQYSGQLSLADMLWKDWPAEAEKAEYQSHLELAIRSITTRDYKGALQSLDRFLVDPLELAGDLDSGTVTQVQELLEQWSVGLGGALPEAAPPGGRARGHRFIRRRAGLQALRRRLEVLLLRAELYWELSQYDDDHIKGAAGEGGGRAAQSPGRTRDGVPGPVTGPIASAPAVTGPDPSKTRWRTKFETQILAAKVLWSGLLDLPRFLREDEEGIVRVERIRLHSIIAGILAVGEPPKVSGGLINHHLASADALLRGLPDVELIVSRMVLNLRRCYCLLWKLKACEDLQRLRTALENTEMTSLPAPLRSDQVIRFLDPVLDDLSQQIEVIEGIFADSRKTLWWWLTSIRYRVIHIEYRQIARSWRSRMDRDDPTDAQLAAFDAERACGLVEDAMNRCAGDVYQMARIAKSFCGFVVMLIADAYARRQRARPGTSGHRSRDDLGQSPHWNSLDKRLTELVAWFGDKTDSNDPAAGSGYRRDPEVRMAVDLIVEEVRWTSGRLARCLKR